MRRAPLVAAAALLLLSACRIPARLYPVSGPFAASVPVPVVEVRLTVNLNNTSGRIALQLPDGENCQGTWTWTDHREVTGGNTASNALTRPDMPAVWDQVFGPQTYSSRILGIISERADLSGDRGTALHLEWEGRQGVGKDNKGNIYKLIFTGSQYGIR